VAAVVLGRGGVDPVGVRAAQQGCGGIAGDRLVALDDQNEVAVQILGDQLSTIRLFPRAAIK